MLDDAKLTLLCDQAGLARQNVPHDDDDENLHREFVAWLCRDIFKQNVDAVFTSEDYGDGFAAVLTASFGHRVAHVCVDRDRRAIPVSGTQVRANPLAHRAHLSQMVFADLVPRICLLGGESTGKTTLAAALAQALDTAWVPEYGRELWVRREGRLTFEDMLHIAETQVALERKIGEKAGRALICDTSPLTTLFYSEALFGKVDPRLESLAARTYDLTLLCVPDFDFVQDGTRQSEEFRLRQHCWYAETLRSCGVVYHELRGSSDERLQAALSLIPDSP